MAYTAAQKKATEKYKQANYKRIPLDVPKAEYDRIKAYSEAHKESVNGFIRRVVGEAMDRDNAPQSAE